MRAALTMLLGVVVSCSTPREQPSAHPAELAAPAVSGLPAEPSDFICTTPNFFLGLDFRSNGGSYNLHFEPQPKEFPDNEAFRFEVWVIPRYELRSAADLTLSVDAAMPQHGHGMNRVPRVSRLEPGHFLVEGMYFHMTGKWELYLDITDGALTERAQVVVELADE